MDRKQRILIAIIGVSVAFWAATAVTANPRTSNTPLYTLRMEQQSNELSFLPTEVNEFAYFAQEGYSLNYGADGNCGCLGARYVVPRWPYTCGTCDEYYCDEPTHCGTCGTCGTCNSTCPYTCDDPTCPSTCPNTCNTCPNTCKTCQQYTCFYLTCNYPTCFWDTCIWYTCDWPTCIYC